MDGTPLFAPVLFGGAVLFFTAGHTSEPSAATGMLIVPSVTPGGGGLFLKTRF